MKSAIGLDISLHMLNVAKTVNKENYSYFVRGTATRLLIKDKVIDVSFAIDLLEHVTDPQDALLEQGRISKYAAIKVPLENAFLEYFVSQERKKYGHIPAYACIYA